MTAAHSSRELLPPAAVVERLQQGAATLQRQSHADLAALASACQRSVAGSAAAWVAASQRSKGWQALPLAAAEEWLSGPVPVLRFLQLLQRFHRELASGHLPRLRLVPGGDGSTVQALPAAGLWDRLLLPGVRATLHCLGPARQVVPEASGGVALVLGAGNVTATPVLDALEQVLLHRRACVVKLSPLQASLQPILASALQPLVAAHCLALVVGDAALGIELQRGRGLAAVHLTGSTATWQAIRALPENRDRVLSAELGGCAPALVVPASWPPRELAAAARQLAAAVAMNGGATCLAPRVVVTARDWPQRAAFLQLLAQALAAQPARVPFHPAVAGAYAAALGQSPQAGPLAPALRPGLDLALVADRELLASEPFAPVLLELPLPGNTLETWLDTAIGSVSSHCHGSLAAYLWAPARTLTTQRNLLDRAIARLPHFTVAINTWAGLGYGLGCVPWGVRAGADPSHGSGLLRNLALLQAVQQVVLQAPLRAWPTPPWLPWHRRGSTTLAALARCYADPGLRRLLPVVWHGLRGGA